MRIEHAEAQESRITSLVHFTEVPRQRSATVNGKAPKILRAELFVVNPHFPRETIVIRL